MNLQKPAFQSKVLLAILGLIVFFGTIITFFLLQNYTQNQTIIQILNTRSEPRDTRYDLIPYTAPLEPDQESNRVCIAGPDLGAMDHWVYYHSGEYVPGLVFTYQEGVNCWELLVSQREEYPAWATNTNWTVDFMWPDSWPEPNIPHATVGTSSK